MARRRSKWRELPEVRPKKYQGVQRLVKMFDRALANALIRKDFPYVIEKIGSGLDAQEV